MHLHGAACTVVEVLAWKVEVELLEIELNTVDGHGTTLGDDLYRGAEVFELGAFGEVGDLQTDSAGGHELELAFGHVDGGLAGTSGAQDIGRINGDPVGRALRAVVSRFHEPVLGMSWGACNTYSQADISKVADLDGALRTAVEMGTMGARGHGLGCREDGPRKGG